MTTRFMLVRHGSCAQTDTILLGRSVDAPLSERGEREVEALAARLVAERPTRIFASPRRRTRQTAAIIANASRCTVRTCDALDEIDFGRWSGRSFAELAEDSTWQQWNGERGNARTPAGTCIADVQARIVALIDTLAELHEGESLVLVTHGEIVRSALLHFLARPPDAYLGIEIAPASVSRLRLREGRTVIESINERPYSDACVPA